MTEETPRKKKSRLIVCIVLIMLFVLSIFLNVYVLILDKKVSRRSIDVAAKLIGLNFDRQERKMMVEGVERNLSRYDDIRKISLDNSVSPAVAFSPILPGMDFEKKKGGFSLSKSMKIERPENIEDVAFYPVTALAQLIKSRKITSTELTMMYLERLKTYGPKLECVITLTEALALEQAKRADEEIRRGRYRGPLHGIPYGAKDLLAAKGIKTTWGAAPYEDQVIDMDATVVERLREAGAVLVAKFSMGALAMGDVWFGGKTKNPWNLEQGSSGSSAGSASATAAGLVGFAIGTETWGSIISPSTRCRVTGLRPTYGRVSRHGAMTLSWSMDKIGPICRSVEDCAIVFNAIVGPDGKDLTLVDLPFRWDPRMKLKDLRIGYLKTAFEEDTVRADKHQMVLETIRSLGVDLIPVELPDFPVNSLAFILSAESAAAFDGLTRSNRDDLLVRQTKNAWPNSFRTSRLIPAVEYIQANRARRLLMEQMHEKMKDIDVFVTPSFGGYVLLLTNLTGHPCVVVPIGGDGEGNSVSISFIGHLFEEGKTLAVAKAFQDATDFHLQHPNPEDWSRDEEKTESPE